MSNTPNRLTNICDIFAMLHDGSISTWIGDRTLLTLHVKCEYLAKRINPSYECFFIECSEIEKIALHTLQNIPGFPPILLTDISTIFKEPIQIGYAEPKNGLAEILCSQGSLLLNCMSIKIFDEGKRLLSVEDLDILCKSYWDEQSKILEQEIIKRNPEKYS